MYLKTALLKNFSKFILTNFEKVLLNKVFIGYN